jgi:hypothetical protein
VLNLKVVSQTAGGARLLSRSNVRTAAGSKACFAFTEATALSDEIQS